MIKKIIMLALCIAVLMSTVSMASFTDVASDSLYGKAIVTLSEAGILKGYGNGEFGSKDPLTRAQFAKIIIALSGYEDVAKTKTSETFTDVSSSHWAIGYINTASGLGLITGYPDGSFGADEKITYAQALTIIIRALGYTEAEVGTNWPVDYINKASELELTEGLTFGRNDYITREVAAYVIYNSLSAKEGSKAGSFMLKKYEDVIFYGTNEINSGIAKDEVATSGGTFKKGTAFKDEYLGMRATVRVNSDNELVMIIPDSEEPSFYTVISCDSDEMETLEKGKIKVDSGSNIYYKGAKVSYQSVSSQIPAGSKAYVYGDYIYIESSTKENKEEPVEDYSGIYESFGEVLTKVEDVVIYGVNSVNSGIAADEVVSSGGSYKKGKVSLDEYLGKKVTLRINSDKEIVMVTPSVQDVVSYKIKAASADKFETTEGYYIDMDGNTPAYYKGAKSTYGALYSSFTQGSLMYVYEDYIYVEENKLKGPFTITKNYEQVYEFFGNIENVNVTIDGEEAKITEIEKYDVCYFNEVTERLYVYTERATGIYEKAVPSKENITGIVLSGTTYNSLGMSAKAKLDDSPGSFKIYDRITLLFGNDGSVVDVVDSDGRTLGDMGVLLKAYTALSNEEDTMGKKEYFVNMLLASGANVTYKTDKDYSDTDYAERIGKFFYITGLHNGTVKLEAAKENKLTGEFDKSVPSYADHKLQQNYSILECVYSEKYKEAVVRKINLKDINVKSLSASDIIHVEYANDLEDIAVIYVENITNDAYTFGILTKAVKDDESNYTYELKSSGGTSSYSGSAGWNFVKGEAVMALIKDNKIKDIKGLTEVSSSTEIESYTDTRIRIKGKNYDMDENVTIVYKFVSKSEWNITTLKDLSDNIKSGDWDINTIALYADKKTGGKVRVIRVSLK